MVTFNGDQINAALGIRPMPLDPAAPVAVGLGRYGGVRHMALTPQAEQVLCGREMPPSVWTKRYHIDDQRYRFRLGWKRCVRCTFRATAMGLDFPDDTTGKNPT